jgi:O-antigen/teichoic acid export membrane protein
LNGESESFESGVALQYAAVISMFIFSTLFYFIIAHLLSTTIVGSISLIYAMISIFSVFFVIGFSAGIEHFVSYHLSRNNYGNVKSLIKKTGTFAIISAVIAYAVIFAVAPYIARILFHSFYFVEFIRISGIAISGAILMNIFSSMLLGLKQYRKYSMGYLFVNISSYIIPIALLFIFRTAIYVIIGISIADFINAGVYVSLLLKSYKLLGRSKNMEKIEPFATLIIYSLPLFFSSIMTTSGTYMDRIIVSYFINLSYLGIYNYALVIASVAAVLTMPISNLLIPKLSGYFSLDDRTGFRNTVKMLLNVSSLIYIPGAMGIAAVSKITLYIFAGPSYVIAYIPLIIIMFVTSLFIGTVILASAVKSVQKSRIFIFSSGAALLSNIILSIVLIPRFNIIGAGIAYSSMTTVNFAIVYSYARKLGISNYDIIAVIKIWISSIILFIIIFAAQFFLPYNIFSEIFLILAGIAIYLLEIKFMKLIGVPEKEFIISVVPSKFTLLRRLINKL